MTLTKADIVTQLSVKHKFSDREAKALVENFFETLKTTIESGERVMLSGFGTWETRSKGERPGRNPKTNEPHVISARRVCVFGAGMKLRLRCEQPKPKEPQTMTLPE